jgi:branched-chain amino acid transport system permease protein
MGLAVLAAIVAGTGAGVVVELLAGRLPHHLDQALVTIGVALIGGWCLTRVYGAQPRIVDPPPGMGGIVSVAGHPYPVYRLALIAMAGCLAVGVSLAISRTRFGVLARATAVDAEMVAQTGVEPRLVRAGTVAAGSALAAVAGVLGAPVVGPAPGVDHVMVMLSLVVVVVGGIGSTRGALLAALLVGQLQTTGVAAAPSVAPYLAYACLAAALVLRGALTQPVSR